MAVSELLAPLCGAEEDAPTLAWAAAAARALDTTATGFLATPDPAEALIWSTDGAFGSLPGAVLESARAGTEEAWVRTQARAAAHGPILTVERAEGSPEELVLRRAALCDLVVMSCACARGKGLLSGVFEALLIQARAPMLVARGDPARLTGPAVIAWDGSFEAARAVRAAIPVLALSRQVVILQAEPLERPYAEPARLVAYLVRHGVANVQTRMLSAGGDVARRLLDAAGEVGAGLFVAGAYGHSRAQEFVFGGATRAFLSASASPALLLRH
jgi:nucleotide-binding universal stress UspA family protein